MWKGSRKYVFIAFLGTQPNTIKYFPKYIKKCNQIHENNLSF